jgi:hypothetical protein
MVPTFTNKRSRRYSYYVCRSAQQKGWAACPSKAVAADVVDGFVLERLREFGSKPDLAREAYQSFEADVCASHEAFTSGSYPEPIGVEAFLRTFARFHIFADTFTREDQAAAMQRVVQEISYDGTNRRVRIRLQPSLEAFCAWMAEYEERYVHNCEDRQAAVNRD